MPGVFALPLLNRFLRISFGVARIAAEGNAGAGKKTPQPLQLVVRQRVHGVKNHGANAVRRAPLFELCEDVVDDRQQEAFGFTRTGSCDNRVVSTSDGLPDRFLLVNVQRTILIEPAQAQHTLAQDSLFDEVSDAKRRAVRWCRLEERSFCEKTGFPENTLELPLETGVREVDRGRYVLAVQILDSTRGLNRVELLFVLHVLASQREIEGILCSWLAQLRFRAYGGDYVLSRPHGIRGFLGQQEGCFSPCHAHLTKFARPSPDCSEANAEIAQDRSVESHF